MKKFCYLFTVLTMLMFISCSSNDDSMDVNLTPAEIKALLEGTWTVNGELRVSNSKQKESFDGRYKGMIEFKGNKYTFKVTEGDKYTVVEDYSIYLAEAIVCHTYEYSIVKIDGKKYIKFRTHLGVPSGTFNFEIVSLNNNSFKLILDTDNVVDNEKVGRIYMSMYSN